MFDEFPASGHIDRGQQGLVAAEVTGRLFCHLFSGSAKPDEPLPHAGIPLGGRRTRGPIEARRAKGAEADFSAIHAQHQRLFDGLKARDPAASAAAMEAHLTDVLARLEKTLPEALH